MDATTMPSIASLLNSLSSDYPHITFTEATAFAWSPDALTVFYSLSEPHAEALLLHELSHGLLEHHAYNRDVELLVMESAAWQKARELSAHYGVTISEDTAEDNLDTYREWLHARSTCPACTATGYQDGVSTYSCPACRHRWKVNEAKICALRRRSL